jgi:hypothetical protein
MSYTFLKWNPIDCFTEDVGAKDKYHKTCIYGTKICKVKGKNIPVTGHGGP